MNPLEKLHKIHTDSIADLTLRKMHTRAMDFYDDRDKLNEAELDMYEGIYQQIMEHIEAGEQAQRNAEEQKKKQLEAELKNLPMPHVEALKKISGTIPVTFNNKAKGINLSFLKLVKDPENESKKQYVINESQKLTQDIDKYIKTMAEEKQKQAQAAEAVRQQAEQKKKEEAEEKAMNEAREKAEAEAQAQADEEARKKQEDEIAAAEAARQEKEKADTEKKRKEAIARQQAREEHNNDPVNILMGDTD